MSSMMCHKIYTLTLSLIVGSLSLAAQESKNTVHVNALKANNAWIGSLNAAGLVFNRFCDFSYVEAGFQHAGGDYRNVTDPTSLSGTRLVAESYRKIKNVYFYGKFDFNYIHRQNKTWASVLYPYHSPIFLADSVPGRQTLESYQLDAGIGTILTDHWSAGGYLHYQVASNAKKKDVRNNNTYMVFEVYPGILYRSKHVNAGTNFIYRRETEEIKNNLYGEGVNHKVYYFEGMWFYTSITTNSSSSYTEERRFTTNTHGGAAQVEIVTGKIKFLNEFSGTRTRQSIWTNFVLGQRGGSMERVSYAYDGHLQVDGRTYRHVVQGNARFHKTLGYENIQQYQIVDLNPTWVQHGKKNKSVQEATTLDARYTLQKNRTRWNHSWEASVGIQGFRVKNKYKLYPVEYSQKWENVGAYATFNKNILFKTGMLDGGLHVAYTRGGGTAFTIKSEDASIPGTDLYPQRTDLLQREFDYITADQCTGELHVRYTYFLNKDKGTNLYADVHTNSRQAVSGNFKNDTWTTCTAMIGFSF